MMRRLLRPALYAFEEAAHHLAANRMTALLAALAIGSTFFMVGLFLLVHRNAVEAVRATAQKAQVNLFLRDDVSEKDAERLRVSLEKREGVAEARYLSKEDAARELAELFPGLENGLAALGRNPLPASVEVTLRPEAGAPDAVRAFVREALSLDGVTDAQADLPWLERVEKGLRFLQWLGWAVTAAFLVSAAFTLSNVVHLTVHAREDEIAIMRVIGATNAFIKAPFLIEAAVEGAAGAAAGVAALYGAFRAVRLAAPGADVAFLSPDVAAALVAAGLVMGVIGSVLALRRLPNV